MRFDILTLFPRMFEGVFGESIVKRACENALVDIKLTNIRDFARDNYGSVDDKPYGGGPGMVMMCQPIFDAVAEVCRVGEPPDEVILMTPQGVPLDQKLAAQLASRKRLILIAGHYEGFDERIRDGLATLEISLGDFVLSGGEIPAMALVDAVIRLLPGALGDDHSSVEESFSHGLLEYPHYTRPAEYAGMKVPEILLSGHHKKIEEWRHEQALLRTRQRRPDLLNQSNQKHIQAFKENN